MYTGVFYLSSSGEEANGGNKLMKPVLQLNFFTPSAFPLQPDEVI